MKIGLTNPTTWPWVRRGAERFLNELAAYLAGRGHSVIVISGKPGPTQVRSESGFTTVCHRQWWHPILAKAGIRESHTFFPVLLSDLLRRQFDVVLSCAFVDTYAAMLARRVTGTPCVLWANSLPPPVRYVREISIGGGLFRKVVREADEIVVLSGFMQQWFRQRHARPGLCIPVPVDTEQFPVSVSRDHRRPVILCASALDDVRKGGTVLMRAFDLLKRRRPEARLTISAFVSGPKQEQLLDLIAPEHRADVNFSGAGKLRDLPSQFGAAAVCVIPSMWESFGMVALESMACGTPVVGTRSGALPELIASPAVGRLFDPGEDSVIEPGNAEGLAQAMAECLELSRSPETAGACRRRAEQLSWRAIGPQFENLFERLARTRGRVPSAA